MNTVNHDQLFNPLKTPPASLFLLLTSECNMRCKQCHMWLNEDAMHGFTLSDRITLIKGFQRLNPKGTVILCGGEVFLKEEEFFTLTKLCRDLQLNSITFTNGSLINSTNYERLLSEGPEKIFFSLDSHINSIHDYIRGIKGSCEQIKKALKDLVEVREATSSKTKLYTNSILFEKNITHVHEYIAFAKKIGIDGVSFERLLKTYQNRSTTDNFYQNNFFQDESTAISMLDEIIAQYHNDSFILTNTQEFEWMKAFISNPDYAKQYGPVCGSHKKNILVSQKGEYTLCGNMYEIPDMIPAGNAKEIPIDDFWRSQTTMMARNIMDKCNMDCGYLAAYRDEHAKIKSSQNKRLEKY